MSDTTMFRYEYMASFKESRQPSFLMVYLGWQESITLLAQQVEAEVPVEVIRRHCAKRVIMAVISAVFVFGSITAALADQGDWSGGIRSSIQKSKQRIVQGIERGSLNRHEADTLNAELGAIINKIDCMKADSYLNSGERIIINRDLYRLARDVFKVKHNAVSAAKPSRI